MAGAAIGQIVGGKMGCAIGAVLGGVAGIAICNEGVKRSDHLGENLVEAVKEAPERFKEFAADRFSTGEDAWTRHHNETSAAKATVKAKTVETETVMSKRLASDHKATSQSVYENSAATQSSNLRAILPARTHFYLGVALGRQGKLTDSIDEFQQALRLASQSAETHYNLGIALMRQGDRKQAL